METSEEKTIWRKIETDHKYRIWRKDYNGQTFYNIMITQKQYDGTARKYYIPITFKKGVDVPNETDIKIKAGIENLRENNNVEEKRRPYCPIFSYMVTDFEIVERQEQVEQQAYADYRDTLEENEMEEPDLPF